MTELLPQHLTVGVCCLLAACAAPSTGGPPFDKASHTDDVLECATAMLEVYQRQPDREAHDAVRGFLESYSTVTAEAAVGHFSQGQLAQLAQEAATYGAKVDHTQGTTDLGAGSWVRLDVSEIRDGWLNPPAARLDGSWDGDVWDYEADVVTAVVDQATRRTVVTYLVAGPFGLTWNASMELDDLVLDARIHGSFVFLTTESSGLHVVRAGRSELTSVASGYYAGDEGSPTRLLRIGPIEALHCDSVEPCIDVDAYIAARDAERLAGCDVSDPEIALYDPACGARFSDSTHTYVRVRDPSGRSAILLFHDGELKDRSSYELAEVPHDLGTFEGTADSFRGFVRVYDPLRSESGEWTLRLWVNTWCSELL